MNKQQIKQIQVTGGTSPSDNACSSRVSVSFVASKAIKGTLTSAKLTQIW